MARTALGAVRYANTRRLPPQLAQVKTSHANVLLSNSAQSTRGFLSSLGERCCEWPDSDTLRGERDDDLLPRLRGDLA
ncbi:hypothetical protein F0U62_08745 [Cystobacter fuscus]|nr:hypothetical protein F0U62_08745 [Cystobacter fuscus]